MCHLATGDMLRAAISSGSSMGVEAKKVRGGTAVLPQLVVSPCLSHAGCSAASLNALAGAAGLEAASSLTKL